MVNLIGEDKEVCKSNILLLAEAELTTISSNNKSATLTDNLSDSIRLIEAEVLAYLLNNSDNLPDNLEFLSDSFTVTISDSLSDYLDYLLELELPSEETIEAHLDLLKDRALKRKAEAKLLDSNSRHFV